jgi:hypothetical protein
MRKCPRLVCMHCSVGVLLKSGPGFWAPGVLPFHGLRVCSLPQLCMLLCPHQASPVTAVLQHIPTFATTNSTDPPLPVSCSKGGAHAHLALSGQPAQSAQVPRSTQSCLLQRGVTPTPGCTEVMPWPASVSRPSPTRPPGRRPAPRRLRPSPAPRRPRGCWAAGRPPARPRCAAARRAGRWTRAQSPAVGDAVSAKSASASTPAQRLCSSRASTPAQEQCSSRAASNTA